jgi:PhnB protein
MVDNPPAGFPVVTPYLLYNDVDAALDLLVKAFGFEERVRMPGPDGKAIYAEAAMGGGVVMMGNPGDGYKNPAALGSETKLIYVYVDDVDAHYERARGTEGIEIIREPADQFYGDRTYGAKDSEGHEWSFAQHVREVAPEDMHP